MRQTVRIISALTLLVFPTIASAQDIVLHPSSARVAGKWVIAPDDTAPGGQVVKHPNANAAKVETAAASPSNYFDITFTATAGQPYRVWLLGRAQDAYWGNDSVYIQFSDSVTSSGSPTLRIGTTSAEYVNLEDCAGCGVPSGFAWQDNGYGQGVLGPLVYFGKTGTQTLRVQTREDGLAVSQILLSPSTYLNLMPPIGSGGGGGSSGSDVVLRADSARVAGKWVLASDSSAPSGKVVRHPNANAAKVENPLASPSNYFEMTFSATAGKPYRLWVLGRAQDDYWANDSVWVQFSHSTTSTGSAAYRIGTTSGAWVNLEDCSGCGLEPRFAWQDNGYGRGVLGPVVYFSQTGTQTLRVQTREDGLAIDQILLSPVTYLNSAPPAPSGPAPSPTPPPPDDPEPPPPSPTTTELKVLSWNTHHGTDTAGVCSVDRIADWIVRVGANVVALNEVEKGSGWCSGMDQPARYLSQLQSKTGKTWYASFAQRDGNTYGQGNLVLSLFPLEAAEDYQLSGSRSVARAQMLVNGIRVNVYATHLDNESASLRMTELLELRNWADNYPEQRIVAGDFNAWDGAPEILELLEQYFDAWRVARSAGTAVGYSGNTGGATKGGARIDYVFYSRGASRLTLKQARVFDIVQSNGVSPSDHRPVLATFEIK